MADEQGDKNTEISDSEKKLGEIGDVLRDAIKRFDSLDQRMDALEQRSRADAARKDGEGEGEGEHGEIEPMGEPREPTADSKRADKARRDSEEKERRADKARRDAEEEEARRADAEEEERRADNARRDSESENMMDSVVLELAEMKARLARLTPRDRSADERERFAMIQEQAEPAFQAFSDRAPPPLEGETPTDYKRRLASKLQKHSPKWDGHRLNSIGDEGILDNIVGEIYADSISAARRGVAVLPGELREITSRSAAGHTRVEFQGDPSSWMNPLAGHTMRATGKFNTPV